ncbi:MAG: hypothetical protein K0Q95_1459 [Bacteroidota bacterium]|jgi:hypothetical protein|nr:hypothetical protein [Bacteroidota bacterium]
MKKIIPFILAGSLCSALLFSGCEKEEEPEPSTPGATDPRDAFNGNWAVSENSTETGASTYNLTISDSSNASYLLIAYLWGTHTKIRGTVSGSTLTIPSQIVEGNSFSGAGVLANSGRLNITYWVNQGASVDTVTAVLTK